MRHIPADELRRVAAEQDRHLARAAAASRKRELKQKRQTLRELSRERRRQLIEVSVAVMRPCETPFNAEGPLRSGYRSGLCLEGWGWAAADAEAEHIVLTALRLLGARRPNWAECQPSWTQEGFDPYEHTVCVRCGRKIPDERDGGNRGVVKFCSELCAQAESTWRMRYYGERVTMAEHLARCAARRQRVLDVEIDCPRCAKPFKPGYNVMRRRFCSVACADAGKPRRVSSVQPRPCVQCGLEFKPRADKTKYCSPRCYHAGQVLDVRGVEAQCPVCSAIFRYHSASQPRVCCSRRCAWVLRKRGESTAAKRKPADDADGPASARRCA